MPWTTRPCRNCPNAGRSRWSEWGGRVADLVLRGPCGAPQDEVGERLQLVVHWRAERQPTVRLSGAAQPLRMARHPISHQPPGTPIAPQSYGKRSATSHTAHRSALILRCVGQRPKPRRTGAGDGRLPLHPFTEETPVADPVLRGPCGAPQDEVGERLPLGACGLRASTMAQSSRFPRHQRRHWKPFIKHIGTNPWSTGFPSACPRHCRSTLSSQNRKRMRMKTWSLAGHGFHLVVADPGARSVL